MPKRKGADNKNPAVPPFHYRGVAVMPKTTADQSGPATLDEETRSVEVVCATETPVPVLDYDRWEIVPEILLMSGCQIPASGQIPLLDSHMRYNTSTVIGSCRELRVEGTQLIGRVFYSAAPEAEGPYLKMTEGHLTDYSIGYRYNKQDAVYIPDGETGIVDGRTFTGPVKVVRKWTTKELSACPIGADELAKARSATAAVFNDEGEDTMNERLRKYLESRGLSTEATEEEAWRFLEKLEVRAETTAAPTQATAAATSEDLIRAAVREEQARISEIRAMCERFEHTDLAADLIGRNVSVADASRELMQKIMAAAPTQGGAGFRGSIEMGADERDKFRSAAEDSILVRAGSKIEKPAAGALDLAGFSLRELAREALRMAGLAVVGNPLEMIGRALTTSDLPNILANVANKSLFEGYNTADETWMVWCATGSLSDFKTASIVRASETEDLDEILESGEYKHGKMSDAKESVKLATYGKLFALTRQTIINDDLGALTDIPRKHGEAWARKVGDIAYAVLTANAAMADGTALFHASHGNLGTAGVISETTAAEAIKLMKLQKDIGGKRRLNIRAQYFIAPAAIEGAAEIFFNSGVFAGANTGATRTNPYAGSRFTRVFEARLDDSSATAYYFAGPQGKTVKVFFLNGQQGPYLETKTGWDVDGVEFKVRGDAAAKAVDWKAMVKNAGA